MKKSVTARIVPIGLVFASLLLAAIGGELFVRAAAPQSMALWVQSPDGVALLQPDRRFRVPPWDHLVETNELGHRDVPHQADDTTATRIVILGDSFAEALTVPLDAMFARQLEDRLSASGPTTVVNAGISGWGTDDQLRYFEAKGATLSPDLVLCLFTLYNDVKDNLEREFHRSTPQGLEPRSEAEPHGWSYRLHRMKAFIASRFHLAQLVRLTLSPKDYSAEGQALQAHWVDLVRADPPALVEEGWALTYDLLDALADSTRTLGAELVLVVVPMQFQVDPEALADFLDQDGGPTPADLDLDSPQRALQEWGKRKNVSILDLRERFEKETQPSRPLYLKDDGHWNADGHAVAAEAVSEWLVAEGLLTHRSPNP